MLADDLKNIAINICNLHENKAFISIYDFLKHQAKLAAHNGKFTFRVWLSQNKWDINKLEDAIYELRKKDGFEVIKGKEYINWFNSEEYIILKW